MTKHRWARGKSLCAYCGVNIATTGDHAVPDTLFIVKDEAMVTVPACQECQKVKGRGERDLRNFCTMEVGGSQHVDMIEHAKKIVDTNEATRAWLERTLAAAKEVILVDDDDNEVGRALEFAFTTDRMIKTLEFVFRGLYWDVNGIPLPEGTPVEVTVIPWTMFPDFMCTMGAFRQGEPTVKGSLTAWWSQLGPLADVGPETTVWVLCVNDGVAFYGATGQAALPERKRKEEMAKGEEQREGPRRIRVPRDANGHLMTPPQ